VNYLIARVSDPDQKKALPAQTKRLKDYAKTKDWVEGADYKYVEFDETAFKDNRKRFKELVLEPLLAIKDKSIVVFDKVDRFSRDSSSDEKVALVKLCKQNKIELHFPHDHLIMNANSAATEWFQLDINIALAGYYSAAIRDNVKRRFDQMLDDGLWVSRAPIGYVNYQEHDANGKVIFKGIKLDSERDYHIRRGFELRSTGLSYKAIAQEMKKAGLRSRTEKAVVISAAQWEEILKNPFYVGRMIFKGKSAEPKEYDHNYDTIIEPWLWDKVQEVKNRRANGKTKYNSKPFLFKNLKCQTCGYSITFDGPKHNGKTYGKCTEYGGKHGAVWIDEELLINQIRKLLKSIELPKKLIPDLVAEIDKNHASEQERYTGTKTRLQKEYDELDEELEDLFKDRKQFKSRHDVFERMVKKIEKRQKELQDDLQDHSAGDKSFVIGASYLLDVCSRAVELFDAESTKVEQKRYLIDFILSNATLDDEKLQFTLKEPFEAVLALSKTGKWYTRQDLNLRPSAPQADALSS
jgi:site-specific DNA recombinase